MATRKISTELKKTIESYIKKVSQFYRIDAVYLFGSFAKGNQHQWSDIDLAIVSKDIKDEIDDMSKLFYLTCDIDERIEPHPFHTDEFNNKDTSLINEIINTGIPVYNSAYFS